MEPPPASALSFSPLAWLAWALAALAGALIARNPYIQVLLLAILLNVLLSTRLRRSPVVLRLAALISVMPVILTVAFSRFGTHVMFMLPGIPVVGGAWTFEALAFGATTALALLLTITVFAVLQGEVRSGQVLNLLPRPLYRTGTVVALSLAFVPQTVASLGMIAEARRLRGRPAGWRSAPGLFLPLLLTTLERALQYAESLDARGFGSRRRTRYRPLRSGLADAVMILAASACGAGVALVQLPVYDPYLRLTPIFPSAAAIAIFLPLALPALLRALISRHVADHD